MPFSKCELTKGEICSFLPVGVSKKNSVSQLQLSSISYIKGGMWVLENLSYNISNWQKPKFMFYLLIEDLQHMMTLLSLCTDYLYGDVLLLFFFKKLNQFIFIPKEALSLIFSRIPYFKCPTLCGHYVKCILHQNNIYKIV